MKLCWVKKGALGRKCAFLIKGAEVLSQNFLPWIGTWCLEQSQSHFKTKRKRGLRWQQSQHHWASEPATVAAHVQTVQFSHSVVSDSLWPQGLQHARLPCPSPTPGVYSNTSIQSVMPSNHLIFCRPLFLLPSVFPCIRVFSSKSVLYIKWPNYWSFSFSISPSNEYSALISLGLISLQFKGLLRVFSKTTVQKCQFSADWINNYLYKVL